MQKKQMQAYVWATSARVALMAPEQMSFIAEDMTPNLRIWTGLNSSNIRTKEHGVSVFAKLHMVQSLTTLFTTWSHRTAPSFGLTLKTLLFFSFGFRSWLKPQDPLHKGQNTSNLLNWNTIPFKWMIKGWFYQFSWSRFRIKKAK